MNPRVSDSPLDAPTDLNTYQLRVREKWRAVLAAAAQLGAEVLVCPDLGCGVFENDPTVVGALLGEALREFDGSFKELVLTGRRSFADAAMRAASPAMD